MSTVLSVISLILVVVILVFLQLPPATFSLFYHYALGKYSRKKADDLSLSFILGAEIFGAAMWLLVYFILYAIFINLPTFTDGITLWILAGVILAEAILSFFCYFRQIKSRKKSSTALFIPRRFAANLALRARDVKNKQDALLLGFFIGVPELLFSLPLFIVADLILLNSIALPIPIIIFAAVLATTLPLFSIRTAYRTGENLASIQRTRVRSKPFLRYTLTLCYLALALILINLGLS